MHDWCQSLYDCIRTEHSGHWHRYGCSMCICIICHTRGRRDDLKRCSTRKKSTSRTLDQAPDQSHMPPILPPYSSTKNISRLWKCGLRSEGGRKKIKKNYCVRSAPEGNVQVFKKNVPLVSIKHEPRVQSCHDWHDFTILRFYDFTILRFYDRQVLLGNS